MKSGKLTEYKTCNLSGALAWDPWHAKLLVLLTKRDVKMLDTILVALALLLIVEGLGPMLFPNRWQRFMLQMAQQPLNQLRSMGGVLVVIGVVSLVYLL